MPKKTTLKICIEIIYIILSVYLSQYLAITIVNALDFSIKILEILYYIVYILLLLVFIFVAPKLIRHILSPITPQALPTFTDLGLAPIAFIIVYFLTNITTQIFTNYAFFDPSERQDIGVSSMYTSGEKIIFFIILCLIIPVLEELIFRGIIYSKLKSINSKKYFVFFAILVTSLVFAIMHKQWNVGIMTFWLSVVSCLLYEITGTLYASILLHILKNTIAFLLLYVVYI